ncbi:MULTISPECIES: tripartite tricarboxylate transporter substrate binding protein [Comamonas]|nr:MULTISPECIES: tripartite tricarboxylate transporter substrate binding protein [Comamonas]MPT10696.1 tripartite tricarboxylate transporter substrate binding protein [Comamonas sp.]
MNSRFDHLRRALLLLAVGSGLGFSAYAQDKYPVRPIKLVIPYAPGGSLDPIGRVLADEMAKKLGQPVVVDNVPGANGMLGASKVLSSSADGYTLLLGITSNVTLAPLVTPNAKYKSSDFDALNMVGTSGLVLVTRPDLPVKSLSDLIKLAKGKPGTLSYGVPGAGSLYHLAMEIFNLKTGANITLIPYKGAGQASVDVIGGQLDMALLGLPAMLGFIESNKMKALAVMSKSRDIGNKNIPAASETPGLMDLDYSIWTGVFAPKGTPVHIKTKLHSTINQILANPSIAAQYEKMGVEVAKPQSMEAFSKFIENDTAKLQREVKATNLKLE